MLLLWCAPHITPPVKGNPVEFGDGPAAVTGDNADYGVTVRIREWEDIGVG